MTREDAKFAATLSLVLLACFGFAYAFDRGRDQGRDEGWVAGYETGERMAAAEARAMRAVASRN